jgi:hypothetical protein
MWRLRSSRSCRLEVNQTQLCRRVFRRRFFPGQRAAYRAAPCGLPASAPLPLQRSQPVCSLPCSSRPDGADLRLGLESHCHTAVRRGMIMIMTPARGSMRVDGFESEPALAGPGRGTELAR